MDFTEKTISSQPIFDGKIIRVKVDTVMLPDGNDATREIVEHPGGVAVIAIDENKCVPVVTQFRKPFNEVTLEIPAGKLNWGEDPFTCGKRELKEETGFVAENYIHLGEFYPTPGFCAERINVYMATGLTKEEQKLDDDEFLNVEMIPLDTLFDMVMNNEIKDAKTAIGILKAKYYLK